MAHAIDEGSCDDDHAGDDLLDVCREARGGFKDGWDGMLKEKRDMYLRTAACDDVKDEGPY